MTNIGLATETELVVTFRDRVRMLGRLRSAGRGLLAALVALTALEGLIPPATALAFAALVGRVESAVTDRSAAGTVTPLLVYVALLFAAHAVRAVRQPLDFLARARIDGDHRAAVARLTAMSETIGVLERPEVQELIWQARADPETFMEGTPGEGALVQLELIGRMLAMVTAGAVVAAYAWWLLPPLLAAALTVQWLRAREGTQRRRGWRAAIAPWMRGDVWADAIMSPGEGKDVRVFGLADWAVDRIQHYLRLGFEPIWRNDRRVLPGLWRSALLAFVPLALADVAVAYDAVRGHVSVAVAAAVFAAAPTVYQALAETPHLSVNAVTCLSAFDRLRDALAGPAPTAVASTGRAGWDSEAAPLVRFEDVGFRYPGTDRQVLDRLDLEIRPGELLGVVGLNGAGKSTLIKLLARLYDPSDGRITVDGIDLAEVDAAAWRRRIAIVFQDFVRYHLSAADNVLLGNAAVPRDDEALAAAAREAGLTAVLDRLPNGWDTPLARSRTGGVDLSGGQWQQVVLARALYAVHTGARILVLDEPTAHLDVRTEFDVFRRLSAHRADATVVLISHRLSTVRQADRIVLVSDGRIAEAGSHDALMASGGRYAAMFDIQAERFRRGYNDRLAEGEPA